MVRDKKPLYVDNIFEKFIGIAAIIIRPATIWKGCWC